MSLFTLIESHANLEKQVKSLIGELSTMRHNIAGARVHHDKLKAEMDVIRQQRDHVGQKLKALEDQMDGVSPRLRWSADPPSPKPHGQ